VQITGTPANGDSFAVSASKNQSLFDTLQNLIATATALPNPASPGNTLLTNRLGESIAALDRALDNTLRVRATVGSQLLEIDALGNAASEKNLQYEKRLSELQDLDYADAISRLNKQQLQLEAAQKSFVQITGLSLFNFL
jgi:flagellar hook-associated protein 3 FlgL